jgi:hypothetical protein
MRSIKVCAQHFKSSSARRAGTVFLLALAGSIPAAASTPYVLGGLVGAISGDPSYGWDGPYNTAFRTAVQTAANFGAGGTVSTPVSTANVTNTGNLSGIQGLVVPWWSNASASTAQVNQVYAFFTSGGDLLLAEDDSGHDPIGVKLGLPTLGTAGSAWTPAGALATGPFGPVGSVTAYFNIGYFSASAVAGLGGTVGATDGGGNVTAAYWPKGTFCPTCGALVMEGDVDVWATGATFAPLNADGRFTLNLVAYMVQNTGNLNGGGPSTTPAPATIWLTLIGLISSGFYVAYRTRQA